MTLLDDLVPEPLQAWTPDVLDRLRARGQIETLFFEFKSMWDGHDVEKTVCAFANRLGGFLLFGVSATKPANAIDSFPGLAPADWLLEVTHNVVGHVSPLPIWDTVQIPSPDKPSRFVVVTRVEESWRTPHVVTTSGRIYLRSPGGSAPVTEKSDVDALVARGTRGVADAYRRADKLHMDAPGASLIHSPTGTPYIIQIAAVPSPALGEGAYMDVLTAAGFDAAGATLTSFPFRLLEPKGLTEDGVLLARGHIGGGRFTDGAIFLRQEIEGSYLHIGLVGATVHAVLEGLERQKPRVHQALVDVRIIRARSVRVDEDGSGRSPGREFGKELWTWAREVPTHEAARARAAAEIMRRVWRTAGDRRGLEPD